MSCEDRIKAFKWGMTTQRKVLKKYYSLKLGEKFGILGKLAASIISTRIFMELYWKSPFLNKIGEYVKRSYIGK